MNSNIDDILFYGLPMGRSRFLVGFFVCLFDGLFVFADLVKQRSQIKNRAKFWEYSHWMCLFSQVVCLVKLASNNILW